MFRPVRQVAALGAKSAVGDCILLVLLVCEGFTETGDWCGRPT